MVVLPEVLVISLIDMVQYHLSASLTIPVCVCMGIGNQIDIIANREAIELQDKYFSVNCRMKGVCVYKFVVLFAVGLRATFVYM